MTGRIPYGRQDISDDDITAVIETLKSDFLTQGPAIPRFEQKLADYCGVKHAIAVNSATSALHIACLALGLGKGDLLWTSPITFVASANSALYCGADVDFVDIDPATYNMCPEKLEAKLIKAKGEGRLPKIVTPVHLTGQSCDMEAIGALAKTYGFRVIEDASHAVGGRYRDRPVGSCAHSDIAIFSFHPVKIITTAEGGVAMTDDPELANKMARFRSHGITRDAATFERKDEGPWYHEQHDLGFNYRITDLQAALGASQMDRLDAFVSKRHEIAARYDVLLADLPVVTPFRRQDTYSAFHLYVIRVPARPGKPGRRAVFESMSAAGIGVNVHYFPVHRQPYYQAHGHADSSFPESESYYDEAITLPLYPGLSAADQDRVVAALRAALDE